ncbi:MAG: hypothetical protein ABIH04_09945, partial [Planctomycetota bacterium]
ASDSKGESIILYNPLNARYLNVDLGQVQDFDGQFRVQVKIQAEAKSSDKDTDHNARLDTPVVDDVTILYSKGEEILLWEIVE